MKVRVRYYGMLKDGAGQPEETVDTSAVRVNGLWQELAALHGFTLDPGLVKAAQNDEFCAWDSPLEPGVLVVFMPPMAGG